MPHLRFDWHARIKAVEGEYLAVRDSVDRLKRELALNPGFVAGEERLRKNLRAADDGLEGTYQVRLFATFEAALRSYDQSKHKNSSRIQTAAALIDSVGGRRGQGISDRLRQGAHAVRQFRNFWAHESDVSDVPPTALTMAQSRARLQVFLRWLPDAWD